MKKKKQQIKTVRSVFVGFLFHSKAAKNFLLSVCVVALHSQSVWEEKGRCSMINQHCVKKSDIIRK